MVLNKLVKRESWSFCWQPWADEMLLRCSQLSWSHRKR